MSFILSLCQEMPLEDGLFEDGNVSETASEASEEDQQRIRDGNKKAKQVRAQIKDMQKHNKQFAEMLSVLLKQISGEQVLGHIFHQLIDYKVGVPAIFAQFLPYLASTMDIGKYHEMFHGLWAKMPTEKTVSSLVTRLRDVRSVSQSLSSIGIESYLLFVTDYLSWMGVVDVVAMDLDSKQELEELIKKELQ